MKSTVEEAARRVRTRLEESHQSLAEAMLAHRQALANELGVVDLALEALGYAAPAPTAKPAEPTKRRTAKKAARKVVKKMAATKPTKKATTQRTATKSIDAPSTRLGRLPTKVKVEAVEDDAERRKLVERLRADGYDRAAFGQRLAPGLYDVIRRDGGTVVTWWPKESE